MEQILAILQSVLALLAGLSGDIDTMKVDISTLKAQIETVGMATDAIGTATFDPRAGGVYSLKSGISTSQTTVPLVSFKFPTSNNEITLSSGEIGYGTIEPNSPTNKEFVSYTGVTQNSDGSATLTGVTRGLDFQTSDVTASTTLQIQHSGGSNFILSNSPQFYSQFWRLNSNATTTAILSFSSTTVPRYDNNPLWSTVGSTTLASKGYADDLSFAGAPDASETVKGIVEMATQQEIASSTSSGGTTAPMFIRNTYSTSTPDLSTGTSQNNFVVVSNNDGYLHPDWFGAGIRVSTTTAWGGATVSFEQLGTAPPFVIADTGTTSPAFWITPKGDVRVATTTESDKWQLAVSGTTTTNSFHMPTNKGDLKVLMSNGIGAGTWEYPATSYHYASTTATTIASGLATSSTSIIFRAPIPSGVFGANSTIRVRAVGTGSAGSSITPRITANGSSASYAILYTNNCGASPGFVTDWFISNRNSASSQYFSGTGSLNDAGACTYKVLVPSTSSLSTSGFRVDFEIQAITGSNTFVLNQVWVDVLNPTQ